MTTRALYVFEHASPLGSAPAHRLFDRLRVVRADESKPARAFSDYTVSFDREGLPAGITVHERG
jgi:CRISPR-associated protein Csd2